MRKKQWMAAVLVGLAVILAGVGSGNVKTRQTKKDKQENTQIVSGVQIVTEDGKKYYDFQDVKENNYRARLLNQVPRNSYDFSNLALDEETGYLSYKDTKGKVLMVEMLTVCCLERKHTPPFVGLEMSMGLRQRILGRNQQWMIKQIQSTVIMLEVIR